MENEVGNVTEGEAYPYYSDYSDYTSPNMGADSNRVKYRGGSLQSWVLRTPNHRNGFDITIVNSTGAKGTHGATTKEGVSPACNII